MDFTDSESSPLRFERCKTPMGTVPISVIMGFDYPLDASQVEGRGEATSYGDHTNNYATRYNTGNSSVPTGHRGYNTDYKDVNTLARLPRAGGPQAWRSSANSQSAYSTYRKQYQEPCRYATALADASLDATKPRQVRARTMIPSSPSPWRRAASASRWSSSNGYGSNRFTSTRFY